MAEDKERKRARDKARREKKKEPKEYGANDGNVVDATIDGTKGVEVSVDPVTGEITTLGIQLEQEDIDQGKSPSDHAEDVVSTTEAEWGTEDHAEDFVMGRLLEVCKKRFMNMAVPPPKLNEQEQSHLYRSLHEDFKGVVKDAIKIIAGKARVSFRAEVEAVNFKGPTDCKAAIKLVPGPEAHALADTAGSYVTILIDDEYDKLLAVPEKALKGQPDNLPLFDQSTGDNVVDIRDARPE